MAKSKKGAKGDKSSSEEPTGAAAAAAATATTSNSNDGASPDEVPSSSASAIEGYVEDELELLQVDLGDMVKMKQVLDEAVVVSVLEHVEEAYAWDNFKLWLMFLACAFACAAQFVPIPFPDSRPVLGVCGSMYFILSGVLQFITTFVDKDAILLTKPVDPDSPNMLTDKKDTPASIKKWKNTDMMQYGLRVRSNLPRFSEWYTVIIEFQVNPKQKENAATFVSTHRVEQTWSVGQFFDKEGYFDEVGLTQEMDKLMERFKTCQFDLDDSSKDKKD